MRGDVIRLREYKDHMGGKRGGYVVIKPNDPSMVIVAVMLGVEPYEIEKSGAKPLNTDAAMAMMGWQRTPAAKKAIAAREKAAKPKKVWETKITAKRRDEPINDSHAMRCLYRAVFGVADGDAPLNAGNEAACDLLRHALNELTNTEHVVLGRRYGLYDGIQRTRKSISLDLDFGVSISRIQQIEEKGLRKLRHPRINLKWKQICKTAEGDAQ